MKLDVSKLRQEVSKLNKLEENYESIYLTYYNIIMDIGNEWNTIYEQRLMRNILDEKKQMNIVYNELKDIISLYSYICNKYSFCNNININLDKEEIITRARQIGTFETSVLPFEDCCTVFTPRHPKTKPTLENVLREEERLDIDGLISRAYEAKKQEWIKESLYE